MTQVTANPKRRDIGRWWIVYPLLLIQIGVAGWLGRQWQPSPDQWAFVFVPSVCIIFPAAWMFEKPTAFKEPWALGIMLQMLGVMVIAIGGVTLSLGFPEPGRMIGASFFACLLGLIWMGAFLILFGTKLLVNIIRRTTPHAR